jgi:hypothetical protein
MKWTRSIPGMLALILGGWLAASPAVRADIVTFQGREQLHGNIYRQDGDTSPCAWSRGGRGDQPRLVRSVVKEPPETFYVKRGDMFLERKEYSKALWNTSRRDSGRGQDWIQEKIDQVNRLGAKKLLRASFAGPGNYWSRELSPGHRIASRRREGSTPGRDSAHSHARAGHCPKPAGLSLL